MRRSRATPLSVIVSRYKVAENGCWEYTGTRNRHGYGAAGYKAEGDREGRAHGVHRIAYEYYFGPIPKGLVVMHTCDNRPCINPAHLKVGTYKENSRDMVEKGRHRWGEQRQKRLAEAGSRGGVG